MTTEPRFTLKVILGCTAALSVPLAVIAAGLPLLGGPALLLVGLFCAAYLMQGRAGLTQALVSMGILVLIIVGWVVFAMVYLYLNKNP